MWVRGLKRSSEIKTMLKTQSHPMWVRGLKHQKKQQVLTKKSRTLCGCVD